MRTLFIVFTVLIFALPAKADFNKADIDAICKQTEGDLRDLFAASYAARDGMKMGEEAGLPGEVDRWKQRYDDLYASIAVISAIHKDFDCLKR